MVAPGTKTTRFKEFQARLGGLGVKPGSKVNPDISLPIESVLPYVLIIRKALGASALSLPEGATCSAKSVNCALRFTSFMPSEILCRLVACFVVLTGHRVAKSNSCFISSLCTVTEP